MNQPLKALLAGCLQGAYFLPFPSSLNFIPLIFFILHCWLLIDILNLWHRFQKKNFILLYIILLPAFIIRYNWIVPAFIDNSNYSLIIAMLVYLFLIHLVIFSQLTVLILLILIFTKLNYWINNYNKVAIYILSYFLNKYLLDFLLIPGGEWIENNTLSFIFTKSLAILGSHLIDSWLYLIILILIIWIKGEKPNLTYTLASGLIIVILVGSNIKLTQKKQILSKGITAGLISKSFTSPQDVLNYFKVQIAKNPEVELWVTTETAIDFFVEKDNLLYELSQILNKNQVVLLGAERKDFAQNSFNYFNSVYFLENNNFTSQIYDKNFLVPFAEKLPIWAKFLSLNPIIKVPRLFTAGNYSLFKWKNKNIAVGICFEAYFDTWYFLNSRDNPIDFYVFLNNETLFNFWGKEFLKNLAQTKAKQWANPVLRVTLNGYSGLLNDELLNSSDTLQKVYFYPKNELSFFAKWSYQLLFFNLLLLVTLILSNKKNGII